MEAQRQTGVAPSSGIGVVTEGVDSPDVVIAKRLLDHAKLRGYKFRRAAPGADGPLVGRRVSGAWVYIIHIAGFSRDCMAVRQRTSSLIVPENVLVEQALSRAFPENGGRRCHRVAKLGVVKLFVVSAVSGLLAILMVSERAQQRTDVGHENKRCVHECQIR